MDTMNIDDYLAQGGVLTSPDNVPARYRGELLRLMSSFVDSELAASAGFAASINFAPGIKERIAASRITLEKADHAERVLNVMADFGTDAGRYQAMHDWASRVARDASLDALRRDGDMRLSVFHYPLIGWDDAVVMNVLMGLATQVQLTELTRISYAPLAEVFREIAPRERRHMELGIEGIEKLATGGDKAGLRDLIAYWQPRVAATFGSLNSSRFDTLSRFGLRRTPNETLLSRWQQDVNALLERLGLN